MAGAGALTAAATDDAKSHQARRPEIGDQQSESHPLDGRYPERP